MVLMLVALTTIIILAFYLSIQTETKTSQSVVSSQSSKQLADLALQTVISQIQQATLQGPTVAWASQPGMIRCYDSSGAETKWYKLYSAQVMTQAITGTVLLPLLQADLPSDNCASPTSPNYGVFVDINSPVYATTGTLSYPILDPGTTKTYGTSTTTVLGCDVQNAPGYVTGTNTPTNNPAAMPVRWLYVLQSGTLVPGVSSGTAGTVTVSGASASNPIVGRVAFWTDDDTCKINVNTAGDGTYFDSPRFQNRMALLTGSMTNESTMGTAMSGSLSLRDQDVIRDKQIAWTPPVAREFQRYIGNPSQTRLSYVLSGSFTGLDLISRSQLATQFSPFLQWGGSLGGLQSSYNYSAANAAAYALATPMRPSPYATLDEWMFGTGVAANKRIPTPGQISASPAPLLTNTRLRQLRFFLSAASEAPEVNLFGQPRISMWPVNSAFNLLATGTAMTTGTTNPCPYTTPFDQLIATASTLIGNNPRAANPSSVSQVAYPYYFNRSYGARDIAASPNVAIGSASATQDWDGTTGGAAGVGMSSSSATRNQKIFNFLHTLAATPIPGYGGTFNNKYSANGTYNQTAEMDQILTEIFDYCRCIDPSDYLLGASTGTLSYAYNKSRVDGLSGGYHGHGQVTPIYINPVNFGGSYATQGFGRFYGIDGVAVQFTRTPQPTKTDPTDPSKTIPVDPTKVYVTGVVYMDLYSPSLGPTDIGPDMHVEIAKGLDKLTVNGQSVFASPSANITGATTYSCIPIASKAGDAHYAWTPNGNGFGGVDGGGDFSWGGAIGPRMLYAFRNATYTGSVTPVAPIVPGVPASSPYTPDYLFCGKPMIFDVSTSSMSCSGATLEIKISYNNVGPADLTYGDGHKARPEGLVQDITVVIPSFNFSCPSTIQSVSNKFYGAGTSTITPFSTGTDLVYTMVSGYNGDPRLIAPQPAVTDPNAFVTHSGWALQTGTAQTVHNLHDNFTVNSFQGGLFAPAGKLIPGLSPDYSTWAMPVCGNVVHGNNGGVNNSPEISGDWDNGIGTFPDGPYINKPDESGAQVFVSGTGTITSHTPYYFGSGTGDSVATYFSSPNRTVASPVMFGSLPTGVPMFDLTGNQLVPPTPWQTLLFRPQPTHFGATSPKDELLLDWFWMPVVEPYAISTTLATAGKVNLNYAIAPFSYITRATALMGVLGSEYVIAVPNTAAQIYKTATSGQSNKYPNYRMPVKVLKSDNVTLADTDGTLRQFKARFDIGEIFKSASEICDIYLVPVGQSWLTDADATTFWSNNQLTGDNTKERPYNGLYSRLTTKSNTYTVHLWVQAITAPNTTPNGQWIENPQFITSEYRGSYVVNRYLDPQDPNIPDFVDPNNLLKYSIESYYKYRILEARRFLP